MTYRSRPQLKQASLLTLFACLIAAPVLAQTSNFGVLTLKPGFEAAAGRVRGYTNGSFALSAKAKRDRDNNPCQGFGTPTPDHIMVLKQNFSSLHLQVNSPGNDTTLLVQGPGNLIRCGDDTGSSKDASVQDQNWQPGTYKIWVGSFEPTKRQKYTLTVKE